MRPSDFERRPERCSIRGIMDPLSDVLRAVRLDGAFFYVVEAAAPWSIVGRAGARARATGAARGRAPDGLPHRDVRQLLDGPAKATSRCCSSRATRSSSPTATPISSQPAGQEEPGPVQHAPSRPLETIRLGVTSGERARPGLRVPGVRRPAVQPAARGAAPEPARARYRRPAGWRSSPARWSPRRGRPGPVAPPCSPGWRS